MPVILVPERERLRQEVPWGLLASQSSQVSHLQVVSKVKVAPGMVAMPLISLRWILKAAWLVYIVKTQLKITKTVQRHMRAYPHVHTHQHIGTKN